VGRTLAPLDEKVDRVRRSPADRLVLGGNVRFAFRHFPLTSIHPHALAAASAAETAARQGRLWDMHELFHRQKALEDGDLRRYAAQLSLDVAAFDRDRASPAVLERIQRDVDSGLASGQVLGTPTLFSDGVVHRGGYDPPTLLPVEVGERWCALLESVPAKQTAGHPQRVIDGLFTSSSAWAPSSSRGGLMLSGVSAVGRR
jgi:hypothetical protein